MKGNAHFEMQVRDATIDRLQKEITALRERLRVVGECIEMLIAFIPEGWSMPLGYSQVVAQAKQTIKQAAKPT
jgi:hypothetical protein